MKAVIGLGNPGTKYQQTKHNIGFMVVDRIARKEAAAFKYEKVFEAEVADFRLNGEKILLIKPWTFMNESGRAAGPLLTYYGIDLKDVLVVHDDLDLAVGKLRLRTKGSAGGHNGIKSLISYFRTPNFNRVRVGIGRPKAHRAVVDHVLSPFDSEDAPLIEKGVDEAADAVMYFLDGHTFSETMNQFNHH
ncbi:MAG: aminoacyl-tRNA hydrolase [Enterococcaceae bacterium]|nr:aminoacyl-tRNA hydrolase [Enterococcaceae bacterium]MCI1919859.1 aminoacyl-tRNA hydrolase [Enterococcaceae bacterium]